VGIGTQVDQCGVDHVGEEEEDDGHSRDPVEDPGPLAFPAAVGGAVASAAPGESLLCHRTSDHRTIRANRPAGSARSLAKAPQRTGITSCLETLACQRWHPPGWPRDAASSQWKNVWIRRMMAGPTTTIIRAGSRQKISGKISFTGVWNAFRSARWRRLILSSFACARRTLAMLTPKMSAWIMARTNARSSST